MKELITEYKSIEHDIKRFNSLLKLLSDKIVSESTLEIGTLVERDRDNDSDYGLKFRVSSITFDTDSYSLTYGIKLLGDTGDYDTYSCIDEDKLKIIKE